MAARSITNAKLLHDPRATIEQAKLYKQRKELHRAFMVLEEENTFVRNSSGGGGKSGGHRRRNSKEETRRNQDLCTRMLLKADWTLEGADVPTATPVSHTCFSHLCLVPVLTFFAGFLFLVSLAGFLFLVFFFWFSFSGSFSDSFRTLWSPGFPLLEQVV
jgi:hypothetical protein